MPPEILSDEEFTDRTNLWSVGAAIRDLALASSSQYPTEEWTENVATTSGMLRTEKVAYLEVFKNLIEQEHEKRWLGT